MYKRMWRPKAQEKTYLSSPGERFNTFFDTWRNMIKYTFGRSLTTIYNLCLFPTCFSFYGQAKSRTFGRGGGYCTFGQPGTEGEGGLESRFWLDVLYGCPLRISTSFVVQFNSLSSPSAQPKYL